MLKGNCQVTARRFSIRRACARHNPRGLREALGHAVCSAGCAPVWSMAASRSVEQTGVSVQRCTPSRCRLAIELARGGQLIANNFSRHQHQVADIIARWRSRARDPADGFMITAIENPAHQRVSRFPPQYGLRADTRRAV